MQHLSNDTKARIMGLIWSSPNADAAVVSDDFTRRLLADGTVSGEIRRDNPNATKAPHYVRFFRAHGRQTGAIYLAPSNALAEFRLDPDDVAEYTTSGEYTEIAGALRFNPNATKALRVSLYLTDEASIRLALELARLALDKARG